MTGRTSYDRAALVLGLASIASVAFAVVRGDFAFISFQGVGTVIVALGLGAVACLAGWFARPVLAIITGVAFLAAAVLQIVLVTVRASWLGGNPSNSSVWLGLGVGLVAVGLAHRQAASGPDTRSGTRSAP